jgi:hypothetical protein
MFIRPGKPQSLGFIANVTQAAKVGLETAQEARVRIAKDEPRMEITTHWDKKNIACMYKKDVPSGYLLHRHGITGP